VLYVYFCKKNRKNVVIERAKGLPVYYKFILIYTGMKLVSIVAEAFRKIIDFSFMQKLLAS